MVSILKYDANLGTFQRMLAVRIHCKLEGFLKLESVSWRNRRLLVNSTEFVHTYVSETLLMDLPECYLCLKDM